MLPLLIMFATLFALLAVLRAASIAGTRLRVPPPGTPLTLTEVPHYVRVLAESPLQELAEAGFTLRGIERQESPSFEKGDLFYFVAANGDDTMLAGLSIPAAPLEPLLMRVVLFSVPVAGKPVLTMHGLAPLLLGEIPGVAVHDSLAADLSALISDHRTACGPSLSPLGHADAARLAELGRAQMLHCQKSWEGTPDADGLIRMPLTECVRLALRSFISQRRTRAARFVAALIERNSVGKLELFDEVALHRACTNLPPPLFTRSTALFTLIGSLALSLPAMLLLFGVETGAMVVVILLIHETGHYLAMRLAGVPGTLMFFVPGFGAAVTGGLSTTGPWQRLGIILAGPLPGIILGLLLLRANHGTPGVLTSTGFAFLALNYTNLLPIWPLDGGQLLQLLIPATSYFRHLALRAVSTGALAAMAISYHEPLLSLLTLIVAYGLISAAIKRRPFLNRRTRKLYRKLLGSRDAQHEERLVRFLRRLYPNQGALARFKLRRPLLDGYYGRRLRGWHRAVVGVAYLALLIAVPLVTLAVYREFPDQSAVAGELPAEPRAEAAAASSARRLLDIDHEPAARARSLADRMTTNAHCLPARGRPGAAVASL